MSMAIADVNLSDRDDVHRPPRYSLLTDILPPGGASAALLASNRYNVGGNRGVTYPPRYSSTFHAVVEESNAINSQRRQGQRLERDAQVYPVPGPQTHEYHISSNGVKNKPWSTLRIYSRSSASSVSSGQSQRVPIFAGNDLVSGSLDLNLENPQTINSISLSLRGQIITTSYDDGACTFLDLPIVTWTRANGDPRTMILTEGDSSLPRRTKKFDGKFSGKYSWPFSFPFPEVISLPGQSGPSNLYPSPPTFLERGNTGNVRYDLVVRMSHGLLRSDSRLQASIVYVPNILPGPSSELCQLAYSLQQSLPGPDVDPAGWSTLPSTTMTGSMFKEKIKFQCTLSLSNPLCYARGTIIPCHLSIRCKDPQALDLLSNPQSIVVRLVRRVQFYQDAEQSSMTNDRLQPGSGTHTSTDVRGVMVDDLSQIEKGVWWTPRNGTETNESSANSRQVRGEIHLRKELHPSCDFPLFKVSYAVELLAFDAPGFTISGWRVDHQSHKYDSSKAILHHPVTIATLHGEGPAPIPVTTPKPRKPRTILSHSTEFNSGTIRMGSLF